MNNTLGWLTFLIAAFTYCVTVEPTASFWDCPEFILSGNKLEVGHPPGAPFFMLTANFFSLFAGPEKVAFMVNIMSAILSALGILFLFWSITHLARKLIVGNSKEMTTAQMTTILASGVVGALAYTWSDTYWFSAVEGEVYGYSSLFTAVVFWLILKWEDNASSPHSDRWLVLIAYLVGLSIGVHLLNLLCIPAIILVVYFKKYPNASVKGSLLALLFSMVIVAVVLYGIVPGVVKVGGWFELLFVNVLGMSFNTGLFIYIVLLAATLVAGIYFTEKGKSQKSVATLFTVAIALLGVPFYGHNVAASIAVGIIVLAAIYFAGVFKKASGYLVSLRTFNTVFLSLLLIMIGYSSYALIVIRSSANTPMDQNSPEDIFTLGTYLNREQYGTRPLLYGQGFDSEMAVDRANNRYSYSETSPIYNRVEKKSADEPDRYEIIGYNKDYHYIQNMLFPRMYSEDHAQEYEMWLGEPVTNLVKAENYPDISDKEYVKMPTQWDNLRFFMRYQVNHMYWRYFLWNFVGRQNDIQGNGEVEHGNWITGFTFIDNLLAGEQETTPEELKENKGRNVFFALPLILGIVGLMWQLRRGKEGKQQFWVVFMLFFMTGLAIVLYLNQTPSQPRERDYAYAGSFYAFAIWIGLGVAAITEALRKLVKSDSTTTGNAIAGATALLCLLVPVQMVSQTWDDHDRSGRYACRDFGQNYLNTMPDEGCPIIFTCGDNDTFPLWYNQEVEGERTDARVCNLSYLQTDWYIDQMRRPAYDSPALPISWKRIDYAGNANNSVEVLRPFATKYVDEFINNYPDKAKLIGENPYEMNNISKYWISGANENTKSAGRQVVEEIIEYTKKMLQKEGQEIMRKGEAEVSKLERNRSQYTSFYSREDFEEAYMQAQRYVETGRYFIEYARTIGKAVIPSGTIYIPIDAEAVKRSGMIVPEAYRDSMPQYMVIDIKDRPSMLRYELIMFDMIANANWERPIYMSMTVGDKNYPAQLKDFFVHEGLAYRITPFNWRELGLSDGYEHPIDFERFYKNIMERFKWGGIKENKEYYADETVRRMIYTHRNLVAQLVYRMLEFKSPDEEVLDILEKCNTELDPTVIPYDALRDNSIAFASAYRTLYNRTQDPEKAALLKQRYTDIASSIAKAQYEYLKWYTTFGDRNRNEQMIYSRLSLLAQAINILGSTESAGFSVTDLAEVLAMNIEKECNSLTDTRQELVASTAVSNRKLQLIEEMYSHLGTLGTIPAVDNRIAATIKYVGNYENRRLKRYTPSRLAAIGEKEIEEIISSLQLLRTLHNMSKTIGGVQGEEAQKEIYQIYSKNFESYAPYVMGY